MILINFVETDFFRFSNVGAVELKYRNEKVNNSILEIRYQDFIYYARFVGNSKPKSMSDKNVIPPRPFSFFNELLLNNETKVKDLQQSVARDFVAGYKPNLVNLIDSILSWTLPPSNKPKTRCINLPIFYKCKVFFGVNLSMIRNFDTPITKVITPEDYVKNASPLFQELSRIDKYVLLVHGFNVSQIQSACEFPLFEKLQESFGVSVLDTCKVALQDSQNWKKHFMYPEMSEKLTDSGMRKYADLIIDVLSSNEVFNAALAQATK